MKKIILGLSAAFLAYQFLGDDSTEDSATGTDSCNAYYNVNGNAVCETLLPDIGYVWWNDAPDGNGWYAVDQFQNTFNMGAGAHETSIKVSAANTVDPDNPQYNNAQQVLNNAYITTSGGPLAAA